MCVCVCVCVCVALLTILPGALVYKASTKAGWRGVCRLKTGKLASLIFNFNLNVEADIIIWADCEMIFLMLLER